MDQFLTRSNIGVIVNEVVVKLFDPNEFTIYTFKGQFDKHDNCLYTNDIKLNINCGDYVKIGLTTYLVFSIQQIYDDLMKIGLMECSIYYRKVE